MLIEVPEKVSEIMTREVASLDENDNLSNLREAMRAMRFRHMPVTDEGRLIGLVSERDLLRISTSSLWPHQAEQDRALGERFRVRDIMVSDVLTVSPETSIEEAGRLLLRERIGCLPVVDASNMLLGIVTSSDYIRALLDALRGR
jgi:CBS domain-containing protein